MSRRERNADEFGEWAYDARHALGLSTEEVARDLGYDRTVLVRAEGRQRSQQMERRLPAHYARIAAERGVQLPPVPGAAPDPVTASTDIDRLVDTVRAQSGYIADLTAAIDQQRQDIADLLDLVRKLLPGGSGVTPPVADAGADDPVAALERAIDTATTEQARRDSGPAAEGFLRVVPAAPASPRTPPARRPR